MVNFKTRLDEYKQRIDADVEQYAGQTRAFVSLAHGQDAAVVTDAFLEILCRGGKRLRGALVLLGYHLAGGVDEKQALLLARAIEVTHAYILIIDDIQDRSDLRRGGPTAHMALARRFGATQSVADAAHTGVALALNAALYGAHEAQVIVSQLEAAPTVRLEIVRLVNEAMMATAHGQMYDILNGLRPNVTYEDVERVMRLKSAEYTLLNPLAAGMSLAGASAQDVARMHEYSLPAGLAFQLGDDVIGTFGNDEEAKSPKSDIIEGKQTALTIYALKHARIEDKAFLRNCLGLATLSDDDFARCQEIIVQCGALEHVKDLLHTYIERAKSALLTMPESWPTSDIDFLRDMASYLEARVG